MASLSVARVDEARAKKESGDNWVGDLFHPDAACSACKEFKDMTRQPVLHINFRLTAAIAIITWAFTVGSTYAIMQTSIADLKDQVRILREDAIKRDVRDAELRDSLIRLQVTMDFLKNRAADK
jgi:hypothetical protein